MPELTAKQEAFAVAYVETGNGSNPAVSATMGKAKLHGLLVEKTEVTGKDGKDLMPGHSPRKLAKAVALILAKGNDRGGGQHQGSTLLVDGLSWVHLCIAHWLRTTYRFRA